MVKYVDEGVKTMDVERQTLRKRWLIATALSCLVLPGIGQIMLGKKKIGIAFVALSTCFLFTLGLSIVKFSLWYFSHLTAEVEELLELSSSLHHLLVPTSVSVMFGILWLVNVIHILRRKPPSGV